MERWGVEGASGWGRHTAIFLIGRGHDVRDVCPNRTPRVDRRGSGASPTGWIPSGSRGRRSRIRCCRGRSSAPGATRVDELHELLGLWQGQRRSIYKSRQHLIGEAESLLCELPLELREQLPDGQAVRPGLAALAKRNRRRRYPAATMLRLRLLDSYRDQITKLDADDKQIVGSLSELVAASGATPRAAVRALDRAGLRAAGRGR